jgi:hypothetical protein
MVLVCSVYQAPEERSKSTALGDFSAFEVFPVFLVSRWRAKALAKVTYDHTTDFWSLSLAV